VDKNTFKTLEKELILSWESLENHFQISVRSLEPFTYSGHEHLVWSLLLYVPHWTATLHYSARSLSLCVFTESVCLFCLSCLCL